MNYGTAEEEIAQRINDQFTALDLSDKYFAAPMPDTDKDVKDFEAQIIKARVAVEYMESSIDGDTALGNVRQYETVKFRLLFEAKKFRGEGGLYTMIAYVKKFLIGYKITDADPLTLSDMGKLVFEPGVWMPFLVFSCRTINAQSFENTEPALGGNLDLFSSI